MPDGPGKYDKQLTKALKDSGAEQGILIVLDGKLGASFCCQLGPLLAGKIPAILRNIANEIETSLPRLPR